MITMTERRIVEFLKQAKTVKIVAVGECGTELEFKPSPVQDLRKIRHDIALAVQDYFNNANRQIDYDNSRLRKRG